MNRHLRSPIPFLVHTIQNAVLVFSLMCCLNVSPAVVFGYQLGVTVVEKIESPEELIQKLGNRSEAIIHDADIVSFLFRTDAAKTGLSTVWDIPFKKQGRSGPNIGQVKIVDSDRLLLSYSFTENDENGMLNQSHYRGPNAPEIPQSVTQLTGRHIKYQINSKHLGEPRKFEVYLPKTDPKTVPDSPLPVVYLTDGSVLSAYVGAIDWKIQNGLIAPIVVVGVNNGGYIGNREKEFSSDYDHRAQEYLAGLGSDRYALHKQFLHDEVIPFVEKTHGVSSDRKDRVLSGFSNGGAYALTAATDNPEMFADVFAYSVAYFDPTALREVVTKNEASLPRFRFAAGTLESFMGGTKRAHELLSEFKVDTEIRSYVAGHDQLMWMVALIEDLEDRFPGPNAKKDKVSRTK